MTKRDHLADARAILEQFVLRARRVQLHSIVADPVELRRLVDVQWQFTRSAETGITSASRMLAKEQDVESLAARLRPLMLQDESIHYDKVVNAITALLREAEPAVAARFAKTEGKRLKKAFAALDPKRITDITDYALSVHDKDGSTVAPMASMALLAEAWLYNDLVHATVKSHLQDALQHSLEERFAAAVFVFARLAVHTLKLLECIQYLQTHGRLGLRQECFDTTVTAREVQTFAEVEIWSAPADAEPPLPGQALPPEWQLFDPERGLGVADAGDPY